MIASSETASVSQGEALAILEETAQAVRKMKASWLRVAVNLKKIREHKMWRYSKTPCSSFEEYVYGVLKINRGVARRMLEAIGYAEVRRPGLLEESDGGEQDVHVPSYDVLNQLRRAQDAFHGREEEFAELETMVYDQGVGRVTLKKEIDDRLADGSEETEADSSTTEPVSPAPTLAKVIEALKQVEEQLLQLEVSKEARRQLFQLVELLEKERARDGD